MAIAVLRSQDCFKPGPTRPKRNPNPNSFPRSTTTRRERFSSENDSKSLVIKFQPKTNLVMGQVKILKRGEELFNKFPINEKTEKKPEPKMKKIYNEEEKLLTTNRFGPEPDKVPKKIHLTDSIPMANFAGSSFVASPSPSSLPFPAFFAKKDVSGSSRSTCNEATNGLRRLLRLDVC